MSANLATIGKAGEGQEVAALLIAGKRIRGGMTLLAFDALSPPNGREVALDLATAIEIAHSASLILDDILDEDLARRGGPALHVTDGEKKALLRMVGIVSLPYAIASRHGASYSALLADAHGRMVEGVLLEATPAIQTQDLYDRIVGQKTGALFSLALRFGALAGGADSDLVEAMAIYGHALGRVLQVADDISDLHHAFEGDANPVPGSEAVLLSTILSERQVQIVPRTDSRATRAYLNGGLGTKVGREKLEMLLSSRLDFEVVGAKTLGRSLQHRVEEKNMMEGVVPSADPALFTAAPAEIARMMLDQ
ncbi:MAG TPA: polyprenyl synthetase family protein [Methanomassiliicoccales archaeon]|nr:polyprenyl synthetase family protein [Methanomassiliicoccales archaeon]